MLKPITATIAVAIAVAVVALIAVANLAPARAQSGSGAPTALTVIDGYETGQVVVSWWGGGSGAFYRIGWVALGEMATLSDWLDAFSFVEVTNRGQTVHIIKNLTPGAEYAFIVAAIDQRLGPGYYSDWAYLTTAAAPAPSRAGASAPPAPQNSGATPTPVPGITVTPSPTPTPAPTRTPIQTLTPTPIPAGTDYDTDNDGLIEISTLAQLDAIRHDLDGDGAVRHTAGYAAAFPDAATNMGCPRRQCQGYELMADLDFDTNGNGYGDANDAYHNDGYGWHPIGEITTPFSATLDGNGHTIANLYIAWTEVTHVGLFRTIGEGAVIRNLTLAQVEVTGGAEKVGALVGVNGGQISNIHISGTVTGGDYVGGLVGQSAGAISDSSSAAAVSGNNHRVGGLAGWNDGPITGSRATGNTTANGVDIGGLVGYNTGPITTSYATGSEVRGVQNVGGLVGTNTGPITASYAAAGVSVTGRYGGGLIGYNYGTITACYATGNVTSGGGYSGGLIGSNHDGTVTTSYSTGKVTGDGASGIMGILSGSIHHSYWDTQTTETTAPYWRSIGKTTRELQSPTGPSGIYHEWDPEYWDFGTSSQYPVLKYGGMDVAAQRR